MIRTRAPPPPPHFGDAAAKSRWLRRHKPAKKPAPKKRAPLLPPKVAPEVAPDDICTRFMAGNPCVLSCDVIDA